MEKNVLRVEGATALYLGVHSLLAGRGAKRITERVLGRRARNGWYRAFYAATATAGLAALLRLLARESGRDVYRVPHPWALGMRVGQAASLAYIAAGVAQIGLRRFLGVSSLAARRWCRASRSRRGRLWTRTGGCALPGRSVPAAIRCTLPNCACSGCRPA